VNVGVENPDRGVALTRRDTYMERPGGSKKKKTRAGMKLQSTKHTTRSLHREKRGGGPSCKENGQVQVWAHQGKNAQKHKKGEKKRVACNRATLEGEKPAVRPAAADARTRHARFRIAKGRKNVKRLGICRKKKIAKEADRVGTKKP